MKAATTVLRIAIAAVVAVPLFSDPAQSASPTRYDVVISGGRVMDPESGRDEITNIGISGGRVAAISPEPMAGKQRIDAKGLVVSPGFIDLHAHGQDQTGQRLQAMDGVTTAIDAELGAMPISAFITHLRGRSIINFGATASHECARIEVIAGQHCQGHFATNNALRPDRKALTEASTPEQQRAIVEALNREVNAGALGYGVGIEYTPGAGRSEIYDIFKAAAASRAPVFVHVRSRPLDAAPGVPIAVAQEVVANAAATGAALHIAHLSSTGLSDTPVLIDLINNARARGLDITSEAYPYTAGSTTIGSEFFSEGWQRRNGIDYRDVQWTATGERLTAETFERYRREQPNGFVIIHMIPETIVDMVIAEPEISIASDGMPWRTSREHPRGAGSFARVLGRYVRERKALDLMTALRKMTILPARRLEAISPQMARKGRIKVGADADITTFDPAIVIDRASFEDPMQPSTGIAHVLVGGTMIVRDGKFLSRTFPGTAVLGTVKTQ